MREILKLIGKNNSLLFYNSFIFRMNLSSQIFVIEGTNSFEILTVDIFCLPTRTGEITRAGNLNGKLK